MQTLLFELGLMALFFLGSGFFSGFESGAVSMNKHRLVHLVRNGNAAARKITKVLRNSHRMLATILVGNNICNVAISTLAASLGYRFAAELGQTVAGITATILLVVCGEFLPKLWFTARPIHRTLKMVGVFTFFEYLLYPLASVCIFLTRIVDRRSKREKRSPFLSRENILFMAQDSEAQGKISAFERVMIRRVLDLQFRKVTEIMTPISRVSRVYESDNYATCLRVFRHSRHSRLPIFSDDDKKCLGVLHLFDLLRCKSKNPVPFDLKHAPAFILPSMPVDDVLPYMRQKGQTLLMVRTEHGRVVGIVNQDDVLKAVIDDELLRSSTERRIHNPGSAGGFPAVVEDKVRT